MCGIYHSKKSSKSALLSGNNTDLIDSYVKENPDKLSLDELAIIESWKHRVKGKFFLVAYLKQYAVFLMEADTELAFGVVALSQPFEATVGSHLPIYLETVLLPFKGKIIYDGVIAPYNISFGRGYREGIKESYQQAKAKHGIITSLPFSLESKKQSDEDLLRFYLKNQQNRERYWEDIWDLIGKKPALRLALPPRDGENSLKELQETVSRDRHRERMVCSARRNDCG